MVNFSVSWFFFGLFSAKYLKLVILLKIKISLWKNITYKITKFITYLYFTEIYFSYFSIFTINVILPSLCYFNQNSFQIYLFYSWLNHYSSIMIAPKYNIISHVFIRHLIFYLLNPEISMFHCQNGIFCWLDTSLEKYFKIYLNHFRYP